MLFCDWFQAVITDVCVPVTHLPQVLVETCDDIQQSSLQGPICGHVGDGNFHAVLLIDPKNEAQLAEAKGLAQRMAG